jgi:hypothetical protein
MSPCAICIALTVFRRRLSVTLLSRLILNLQRAGVGNFRSLDVGATEVEGIHFVGQSLVAPETDA